MRRQSHLRQRWAATADRWEKSIGTVAFVLMLAGVGWWMWSGSDDGEATTTETAAAQSTAATTLPLTGTNTTTTTSPEWPPWCGRYVALRVANEAYDDAFHAHAATYDPDFEAARAAYDEAEVALNEAEAVSEEANREASEATAKELDTGDFGAFGAERLQDIARQSLDDVLRAHERYASAREAMETLTSKDEAEHFATIEAARAYVAASRVYAGDYAVEFAAAVEAVQSHDAASVALENVENAHEEAQAALETTQAAVDEATDAYYAGAEDARNGSAFFPLGHREDAYRAGWDAYHDAQASGDLFGYIDNEPPVISRLSAAEDDAQDRLYEVMGTYFSALGARMDAWRTLDPTVESLRSAAVSALWSVVPENMDWPDLAQACGG